MAGERRQAPFAVVVVAAGRGERLGGPLRKAWIDVGGRPLWWHAACPFRDLPGCTGAVLVLHPGDLEAVAAEPARTWMAEAGLGRAVPGGASRQASVLAGVRATDPGARDVLVHDAARPLVARQRIEALLAALEGREAAFLAHRVPATVQEVGETGEVVETLDRRWLRMAATPQGGRRRRLLKLLERADRERVAVTDEAALLAWGGLAPLAVDDDPRNLKVTTMEDLQMARSLLAPADLRVGQGYDIHRLEAGGPLRLGGLDVPGEVHASGHSDADCLLHALADALLGAAGLPDIGERFPDSDPAFAGADSARLLGEVLEDLAGRSLRPLQVDASVLLERPRLGDLKARMRARVAELLALPVERVSIKARSHEGLDAVGRGAAVAAHCTVLLAGPGPATA